MANKYANLVGKRFHWCEDWSDWTEDGDDPLTDADGDEIVEVCGEWEITSVSGNRQDGYSAWCDIEFGGRDFQIELPIPMLPSEVFE